MSCDSETSCLRLLVDKTDQISAAIASLTAEVKAIREAPSAGYDYYIFLLTIILVAIQLMRCIPARFFNALEDKIYAYLDCRRRTREERRVLTTSRAMQHDDVESVTTTGSDVPLFSRPQRSYTSVAQQMTLRDEERLSPEIDCNLRDITAAANLPTKRKGAGMESPPMEMVGESNL